MRKLVLLCLFLASAAHADNGIWVSNIPGYVTGTDLGAGHYGLDVNASFVPPALQNVNLTEVGGAPIALGQTTMSASLPVVIASDQSPITTSNAANGPTGSAVPLDGNYIAGNKSGNLTGLLIGQQTSANSLACVLASDQSAVPASQSGTWNINNISGTVSLPTGAATAAKQPALGTAGSASSDVITVQGIASMTPLLVDGSGSTQPISGTVTANQGGTWTVQPGNSANTTAWLVTGTGGTFPATQSGTWNINNISGTISLPTGAATSANQSTEITALNTIATNTGKAPINTTGSGSAAGATVSTVATLSAPANAVGFILMNLDTSTANIRWAVGRTASTTLGQQLQPGRDTGFVPVGANVSIIAESGTQNYDVQWVSQ